MKPTKPLQSLPRMIAAGVLMLAVLTAGCAVNWGSIRYSPEATRIFKTYQVLPDHRYYYTGRDSMPDAIIGIDNRYTLVTRFWHEVDPDTEKFKKMTDNIWIKTDERNARGAWIMEPSGKRVGIWYSSWSWTGVKVLEDNQIVIYSPYSPGRDNGGDLWFDSEY